MTDEIQKTYCNRCGEQYDPTNDRTDRSGSIYWVPKCPACNAKITANIVDGTWMEIIGSNLDQGQDMYEYHRQKVHYHARLYHGRLADVPVEGLIERAQHFDDMVRYGLRFAPQKQRDVAFTLRKQAREQLKS